MRIGIIFWLKTLLELICEIILFVLNIHYYFRLFLYGLRLSAGSYQELLKTLADRRSAIDNVAHSKIDSREATKMLLDILNDITKLEKEQEKLFSSIFGIFIAVTALIVSLITLLVKK